MKSLKSRIYLLIFMVALPGISVIYYEAIEQREFAIEQTRQSAIALSKRLTRHQRDVIDSTKFFIQHLAQSSELNIENPAQCSAFLKTVLGLNRHIYNIGAPLADGQLLCNALPLTSPINVADRDYFQHSLQQKSFAIGQFQFDRAAKKTSINFSYPVVNSDDTVKALVVAVVPIDWWNNELASYGLPEESVAAVADTNGTIVASYPDDDYYQGKSINVLGIHQQLFDSSGTEEHRTTLQLGVDGKTRIFVEAKLYQSPIDGDVRLYIGVPIDDAVLLADQHFIYTLIAFFTVVIIVMAGALKALNKSVLEPIRKLNRATKELTEGKETELEIYSGCEEFIALKQNFNLMAKTRLFAEHIARYRHQELASAFSALPDQYFRLNAEGIILDAQGHSVLYEFIDNNHCIGKRFGQFLPKEVADDFEQHFNDPNIGAAGKGWQFTINATKKRYFEARLNRIENINHSDDKESKVLVIRDVTQRCIQEENLRLAALVYANSSEGMTITDAKGTIIDVNPAFSKVTGYSRDEVIGKNPRLLSSGRHDKVFYQQMWAALNSGGRWQGEIYNRRKNGDIYPEILTIDTVYDKNHEPYRRLAMFLDISEKKKFDDKLWQQTNFDPVTNLPNRHMMQARIAQQIHESRRQHQRFALLTLDLDHFKVVNDSLGHEIGDGLLKKVAKRLLVCLDEESIIARQGGDEFVILLPQASTINSVESTVHNILASFEHAFELVEEKTFISCSIGVCFYPNDGTSVDDLLKASEQAMYVAKDNGRNGFNFFTQSMQRKAQEHMRLTRDLHLAVREQQFVVYYQPIVHLATHTMEKAEALVRWHHPEQGIIGPVKFIELAEDTRLINEIGDIVFEQVIMDTHEFRRRGAKHFATSINVSPIQFATFDSQLSDWPERLADAFLPTDAIIVEITEGLMMEQSSRTAYVLSKLKQNGIKVAMDDFGTGYSSLAYIKQFDIDFLKIDQSFVRNLSPQSNELALCEAIIVMAHKLGIKVIAEGIETELQRQLLFEAGCDYGQGYLFSRPVPSEQFLQLLNSHS